MSPWWAAVIVFIVVILPVVVIVLHRLLRPAVQIGAYAADIEEHVAKFPPHIHVAVEGLAETRRLVAAVRPQVERYANALKRVV